VKAIWGLKAEALSIALSFPSAVSFRKDPEVLVGVVRINRAWDAQESWNPYFLTANAGKQ